MAHIRKLNAGRYQARYRGPDGREHARNFGLKMEAERFLTRVEASKLNGGWTDPTPDESTSPNGPVLGWHRFARLSSRRRLLHTSLY